MKNKYLGYKHVLSPEQFFKYVKIMMTYKGPMWVPHGLKFLYGTHKGPIWASCPDSAHMGPICQGVLRKYDFRGEKQASLHAVKSIRYGLRSFKYVELSPERREVG